ncbi:MAG: hypothetical protein DPW16_07950 [Chloroflexi bacterium]|nr:hypothetical protein [Chloroflexota bacterium]
MFEVICQPAPDQPERANEDAFVLYQRDDGQPRFTIAAIDGATSVARFGPLDEYLRRERSSITPAGLAANVARDAILTRLAISQGEISPRDLILDANDVLRELLEHVVPDIFSAEKILAREPQHAALLTDPRKIRLFLPAAVITLATIDTQHHVLQFAHAGDTSLMLIYEDGRVEVPTEREARMNYESALFMASRSMSTQKRSMLEAVNDPVVRSLDRDHRVYHNYVDENGQTMPSSGVGVIDGLPELADYIVTGTLPLDGVAVVVVASDGFSWPAALHESPPERKARLETMGQRIRREGAARYLAALRAEERADAGREKYPRFKLHDDATAVVLTLK